MTPVDTDFDDEGAGTLHNPATPRQRERSAGAGLRALPRHGCGPAETDSVLQTEMLYVQQNLQVRYI